MTSEPKIDGIQGVIYLEELALKGILISLVRGYQFKHDGEKPLLLVIPKVDEVEGVPVHYA